MSLLPGTQSSNKRGRERSWAQGATAAATTTAQNLARETKRDARARICLGKRTQRGTESRAGPGRAPRAGRVMGCVTWLWALPPSEGRRWLHTQSAGPLPSRRRRQHWNPAQLLWAALTTPVCPHWEHLWNTSTEDAAQGP